MAHDEHKQDPWIAHHFDTPRQQFDAGKLGIWVFLVTEVLFFSGLFCAYVLYRAAKPEVFTDASDHLDKVLGGINTIVLLFSSLTMAMAVRAVQLGQNKTVYINLVITMVCAAVFLGVKAVEYSHKWDAGILTRGYYDYHHHAETGISQWLIFLSIPPLILLVGFAAAAVLFKVTNESKKAQFFTGLTLMMGGYFLGAVGGKVYMDALPEKVVQTDEKHDDEKHDDEKEGDEHANEKKSGEPDDHAWVFPNGNALTNVIYRQDGKSDKADETKSDQDKAPDNDKTPVKNKGPDSKKQDSDQEPKKKTGDSQDKTSDTKQDDAKAKSDTAAEKTAADDASVLEDTRVLAEEKRRVGIFFSIYYCMTGLHAFHVIGGMIALSWLLWRVVHGHFRADYFGPVDYVGLYWHLVDLIWIFLFPLLYLIN